jgi:ferredoxin-NADP reductase
MKLVFRERIAAQGNVTRFVFQPETPLSWQPGQYIHYDLPHPDTDSRGTERWFTISSAPFEKEVWITTRIFDADGSSFKRHLLRMEPGQAIEADLPEGDFIVEDPSKSYVFVAGGIGITPFRSILKQLHHDGKSIKVELLYANRDAESIAFKDELEAISKAHDGFSITYYIGDNRIDEAALKRHGELLNDPTYYVSGPEPMVEAFEKTFESIGIDKEHSKFDYFPGYEAE